MRLLCQLQSYYDAANITKFVQPKFVYLCLTSLEETLSSIVYFFVFEQNSFMKLVRKASYSLSIHAQCSLIIGR
jgi:hypothetical protein